MNRVKTVFYLYILAIIAVLVAAAYPLGSNANICALSICSGFLGAIVAIVMFED